MYKWFLASRYLSTKLIAFFGMASVMLCVAMVLVVLSVMGGFLDTVKARSKGLHSELILSSSSLQGFPFYAEFGAQLIEDYPDLVSVTTPVIHSYGIFRVPSSNFTKAVQVIGVQLDDYVKVNDFARGLHYNRYFPGTTHFKPQAMPVVGLNGPQGLTLPPDLAKANEVWRKQETDLAVIAAFDENPFEMSEYPRVGALTIGQRVFASDFGEARYEGEKYDGIIVGCDIINDRRPDGNFNRYVARGAQVGLTLLPMTPRGTVSGEPPVRVPLRYVDDSRTGIFEIDNLCVYVDFDMVQRLLAMDPQERIEGGYTQARANQLLIGLHDDVDMNAAKRIVNDAWIDFTAKVWDKLTEDEAKAMNFADIMTWEDMQRIFINAVEKEKILVTFLFTLISMVAIVLVGCIFYMIVEKKTKDIGILKAIGASGRGVATMFIIYAAAVGIVGTAMGSALGATVVWHINDIQDFLASLHPELRMWSPDVYSFDQIPNMVKASDVYWISIGGIVATTVGSLIPAWIAGRVWPIRALRHE